MTTQKHLEKIRAKCEQLLAIAEKRELGEWKCPNTRKEVFSTDNRPIAVCYGPDVPAHSNAAFTASCAGPAEAGWRATIAAINGLQLIIAANKAISPHDWQKSAAQQELELIIAAWPEELL